MFGLFEFPGAARIGEGNTRITIRKTTILAARKHSDIVAPFGVDVPTNLARFIGG
jgi:hypothetical protein